MSDQNTIALIGRIATDPEAKYTKHNTPVVNFSLANNKRTRKNGEQVDTVSFFPIVIYGKLAEAITPYLQKGKRIAVSGELEQRRWTSKKNKPCSAIEIIASSIQLLDYKNQQSAGSNNANAKAGIDADHQPAETDETGDIY